MDNVSREKRSWIMSRIKGKDTIPEKTVRSLLHHAGFRFCLNRKDLPGSPDIILPKYKTVIFVHGCFWHGHEGCKRATRPSTNIEFWNKKIRKNRERDYIVKDQLEKLGWQVLIVWQCELKNPDQLIEKLVHLLRRTENSISEVHISEV